MAGKRKRNLYDPEQTKGFRLSRSKIDLYLKCARCFYLDRRFGVRQPSGPPFTLNGAVDALLKKEFDRYRELGAPHPLMTAHGIEAVPFSHPNLEEWRDSLHGGVTYAVPGTNLVITGGLDDVWVDSRGALYVVDYKATAKDEQVTLDDEWKIAYKRQVEIYQWLLRNNGFVVSPTAYFVYCNGRKDLDEFGGRLEFRIDVLAYTGSADWVEGLVRDIHGVLSGDEIPMAAEGCEYCKYRAEAKEVEGGA